MASPNSPRPESTLDKLKVRTYKYRLYPTQRQAGALEVQLGFCCDLYNAALEEAVRRQREAMACA
jgi:hypothetical protein